MKYLFFLLTISCFSQNDFNKLNAEGKKQGLWKGIYEESKRPRYEGDFENGAEVGTFNYFDDTAEKRIIATRTFSQNGTVAYTVLYDRKKNIVSEGKTINRQNEGEWKYYHEDSKDIMTSENYSKGKLNGVRKVFFKNGNIAEAAYYTNGLKNGPYKHYTEKGILLEESFFKNDKYDGIAIFRDSEGQIASKGPYVNGIKKGVWEFYENGKLKKKETLPILKYVGKPEKTKN